MAEVYLAEHETLQGKVAIKVLTASGPAESRLQDRFIQEAKAAFGLQHPHIIRVHDVDQADGLPYFVMDYIKGSSLAQLIDQEGPFNEKRMVRLSRQILSALAEAHEHQIIHRDIKPANILVNQRGDAVVTDFGIAKLLSGSSLTSSGMFLGTLRYSSPEQFQGRKVDSRADLYALGLVMYEMATGKLAFDGEDTAAIINQQLNVLPQSPRELNPDLPAYLSDIILTALAKDPDQRFASARAMIQALDQKKRLFPQGKPSDLNTLPPSEGYTQVEAPRPSAPPARKGLASWVWALAALVALLAGGGVWWGLNGSGPAGQGEAPPAPKAAPRQGGLPAATAPAQSTPSASSPSQTPPAPQISPARQRAQSLTTQAQAAMDHKQWDQARALLGQALALDPGRSSAKEKLRLVDQALEKQRQEKQAREKAQEEQRQKEALASKQDQEDKRQKEAQARQKAEDERRQKEAQDRKQAQEEQRQKEAQAKAAALVDQGEQAARAGKFDQARKLWQQSLKLAPDHDQARLKLAGLEARRQSWETRLALKKEAAKLAEQQARLKREQDKLDQMRQAKAQAQAAPKVDPGALFQRARRCYLGEGVPEDHKQAFALFMQAAQAGHAPSQNNVGVMLGEGIGATKNLAQAREWLRRASQGGNCMASYNLAIIYSVGKGVSVDYGQTAKWANLAEHQGFQFGHPAAKSAIGSVSDVLALDYGGTNSDPIDAGGF